MRSYSLSAIVARAVDDATAGDASIDLATAQPAGSDTPLAGNGKAIRTAVVTDKADPAYNANEVYVIPVTKAGKSASVVVDTMALSDDVYTEMVFQGLKALVNGGMTSVTSANEPNQEKREALASKIAAERLAQMYAGTLKLSGRGAKTADSTGFTGPEMTEARRLAKEIIRAGIKERKERISSYSSSEITRAANELLNLMPELKTQARANLAKRPGLPGNAASVLDSLAKDPNLVAKADAEKAKRAAEREANKGTLSAKQAGKVAAHASTSRH